MRLSEAQNLACPIDGRKLSRNNKQLVCDNGHSYDIARQGYVNLLPVQHKRSQQPGDCKAMVVARSEFLDSGIYKPIADKLIETVLSLLPDKKEICLLDAGCGEGYYFDALAKAIEHHQDNRDLSLIGLDISKDAIIQSTKRNRQTSWVVGTNRQPPLAENSVDIILCMFGFFSAAGFAKVLKPDGKIVLVDPGTEHLKELREIIYPELKKSNHSATPATETSEFSLLQRQTLNFKADIPDNRQLKNLLLMTPHFYRASAQGKAMVSKLNELEITVEVVFTILGQGGQSIKQ